MFTTEKINNEKIDVPRIKKINKENILGCEIFSEIYANIWICAKKKSGKSTVVYNIIKKCTDKDTKIFIFAPTYYKDDLYIFLNKYFEENGINIFVHTGLMDDKTNMLKELREKLTKEIDEMEEKDNEKKEKIAVKNLIILDDLGKRLRNPEVEALLKINRHLHSKIIISTQHRYDITPGSIAQIDYALIFKSLSEKYLDTIYNGLDLWIEKNIFHEIYKMATDEKYNFLMICLGENEFRKNFNQLIKI